MNAEEAESLVELWYVHEPDRHRSRIGIPNAGLHVLEVLRTHWPLRETHYLTRGGGQVAGLSGASGDIIMQRFAPSSPSLGTEAGRTSRSTPHAARRLANLLNGLPYDTLSDNKARAEAVDRMQRWLVQTVLVPAVRPVRRRLRFENSPSPETAIQDFLLLLGDSSTWRELATSILAASLKEVLEDPSNVYQEDDDTGERAEIEVADTSLIVAEMATPWTLERCRKALARGHLCVLFVPDNRLVAATQMAEVEGLQKDVEIRTIGAFVAHLVLARAGFSRTKREKLLERIQARLEESME